MNIRQAKKKVCQELSKNKKFKKVYKKYSKNNIINLFVSIKRRF